tara:strand:- start:1443 stop:1739 length:297 start_codon:yes stop_codon:yes gene_type:complete
VLFWNSSTVIRYPDDHFVFDKIFHTYLRGSFGQTVFYGVYQQITYDLLYFLLISIYINRIGILHIKSEGNLFFGSFHFQKFKGVLDKLNDIKILPFQL